MSDATHEPSKTARRREFLTLGVSLGIGGLGAALTGAGVFKFMIPVVTYGMPKQFNVPKTSLPEAGEELLFPDEKVLVRRHQNGQLGAISLVCTHLGCTVNRVTTGFLCPCHGSQYDVDGMVVSGPAPKTLPWHAIKNIPGDMIEIDTGTTLEQDTYFAV
jgi:cytochrome b6-f complex iron-sulfur subunit